MPGMKDSPHRNQLAQSVVVLEGGRRVPAAWPSNQEMKRSIGKLLSQIGEQIPLDVEVPPGIMIEYGETAEASRKRLLALLIWRGAITGQIDFPTGRTMMLKSVEWVNLLRLILDHVDGPPSTGGALAIPEGVAGVNQEYAITRIQTLIQTAVARAGDGASVNVNDAEGIVDVDEVDVDG